MAEAFSLREDHAGEIDVLDDEGNPTGEKRPVFVGATFALADGTMFDVGRALADHGGVIATDEPALITGLSEQPALKKVPVPEKPDLVVSYEARPKAALLELPAARGIQGAGAMPKEELVRRLALADSGQDPNAPLAVAEEPKGKAAAKGAASKPGAEPAAKQGDES